MGDVFYSLRMYINTVALRIKTENDSNKLPDGAVGFEIIFLDVSMQR